MSRLSNLEITIDCPSCRRKIRKRLSQLGNGSSFRCVCGQSIRVNGNGFSDTKRAMERLERSLKRLR